MADLDAHMLVQRRTQLPALEHRVLTEGTP
jgi:hypothetical protein